MHTSGSHPGRPALGFSLVCSLALAPLACGIEDATDRDLAPTEVDDAPAIDLSITGGAPAADGPSAGRSAQVLVVTGPAGPLAGARVAVREPDGQRWQVATSDARGQVAANVTTDSLIVASAAGFAPAARRGAGTLALAPWGQQPETLAARLQDGDVVAEVTWGSGSVPLAEGLAPVGPNAQASLPALRFADVVGHRYAPHIQALSSRGMLSGDPSGLFRPDADITRAETVTMVLRALRIADIPAAAPYSDVGAAEWFHKAVATASWLGLVRGDPDGRFRPRDPVTRAELAALLQQVAGLEGAPVPASFSARDLARSHWAHDAVARLQSFCRAFDLEGERLRPSARATRAETAAALSRVLACAADRAPEAGDRVAQRAAAGTWRTYERHHALRRASGFGTHYGDTSAFHALSLTEKRAYIAARARGSEAPLDAAEMTRSSCVEYAMELAAIGFQETGAAALWQQIDDKTRMSGLKGTELARQLVARGWKAYYVNFDTSYEGENPPDREHVYSWRVAETTRTYYDVPLAGVLLDASSDEPVRQAMDALPFGVFVMRGGSHVVAIADGAVHELARSEGPDQHVLYTDPWRDIIDIYALDVYGGGPEGERKARFLWNSGVVVVPPGTQLGAVRGF